MTMDITKEIIEEIEEFAPSLGIFFEERVEDLDLLEVSGMFGSVEFRVNYRTTIENTGNSYVVSDNDKTIVIYESNFKVYV